MSKEPQTIEGTYSEAGKRQPIISSWKGLGLLLLLVAARALWLLATGH